MAEIVSGLDKLSAEMMLERPAEPYKQYRELLSDFSILLKILANELQDGYWQPHIADPSIRRIYLRMVKNHVSSWAGTKEAAEEGRKLKEETSDLK
ncbi:MAG: hypothetical protein ABI347_09270 [Nitrososphaera sp.]